MSITSGRGYSLQVPRGTDAWGQGAQGGQRVTTFLQELEAFVFTGPRSETSSPHSLCGSLQGWFGPLLPSWSALPDGRASGSSPPSVYDTECRRLSRLCHVCPASLVLGAAEGRPLPERASCSSQPITSCV